MDIDPLLFPSVTNKEPLPAQKIADRCKAYHRRKPKKAKTKKYIKSHVGK